MFINDCIFIAACGPPGGGRNKVTSRFFRYFNIIWMPEISDHNLNGIYTQILSGFLKSNLNDKISDKSNIIVKSTINVYNKIIDTLLPTP